MKLKHLFFTLASLVFFSTAQAQVKVGANPGTIGTNSGLEVEATNGAKMVVTKDSSKVGIGTATPTNKLHIAGSTNPIRIEGVQSTSATSSATPLVIDANGVVMKQSSSTPFPTLRASVGLSTNYDAASSGSVKKVPLNQVFNSDGNFSTSTNLYTIPVTGVYQISGTFSITGSTTNGTYSISLKVIVDNQAIDIAEIAGPAFIVNTPFNLAMAGTVTLPLNAGSTVGLGTVSCGGCAPAVYTGTALYTNMTIVKMN